MSAETAVQLVRSAEELLNKGEPDKAIEAFEQAVREDSKCHVALRYLGMLYSNKGMFPQAMSYCEQALRLQPNDLQGIAFMGACHLKLGQLNEAANFYKRAIALNPNVALFQENLAMALHHQARADEAEAPYRRAIALDPQNAILSYLGLGELLHERGDEAGSAEQYEQAYKHAPEQGLGKFAMAQGLLNSGKFEEAEKFFRETIAAEPGFGAAYRLLAQTLQRVGRFQEAEVLLKKAIELEPGRGASYAAITMGRKMNEADRPLIEQVQALLKQGQLFLADETSLYYALGKAFDDLGDYEKAMDAYDHANADAAKLFLQGHVFQPLYMKAIYEHAATVFTREFFVKNHSLGSESEKPVFILGMLRSGTTLTEHILSCHPDIGPCGELLYWMNENLGILDSTGRVVNEERLKACESEYLALLDGLAPGKRYATNKTPPNYNALGLIHLAFPNAKIIHCKRDPVDTMLSIYTTPNAVPIDYAYNKGNIVYAYKEYRRLMKLYASVLPAESIYEVRYEELISDSEKTIRGILDFLGLPWNAACLHHEQNTRAVNTPTLWQVRQPLYTGSVKRWKKYEPWLGAFAELLDKG
jgi:tetratricopeptide (TPR) repeat protein